jgi:hypothetical protein
MLICFPGKPYNKYNPNDKETTLDKLVLFLVIFKDAAVSVGKWIETHSAFVVAAATVAIAAFTWNLVRANKKLWKIAQEQSKHMETSIGVAKKAAEAAEKSADALPIMERAYVFSNIKINKDMSDPDTVRDFEAELWLKNHGKTPAIIKEIGFGGHYPTNPFNKLHIHHPIDSIIGSGDEVYETRYRFPITGNDWFDFIDTKPKIRFFCIGYIKYITVFGEEDCHPFYWEFDGPSKRFVLVQSEKLNHGK